jgi:hypothetical protein
VSLPSVLDLLLPPNGDLPAAGMLGLAPQVEAEARSRPHLAALLERLVADEAALRALEAEEPDVFAAFVELVYVAYYTNRRVLEHLERTTGYPARPPQPQGYALEPFDERLLATVRARAPHYRGG